MKTNILISGILMGVVTLISAATNDLTSAIQRGLFEEEANQNLGAAIQAYQTVASQFDKDRKLAATAIFRLGECYRKQGNTNEAAGQYERILREFSDQPTLVTLSRQNLATLGSTPAAPAAPVMSDAARQEQKRLLEEEIKLVQKQLAEQQKQIEVGRAAPGDLLPTEREILKLKRQVAALDAGLPISIAATETTAPAVSTEADEVKRIQALIKDSPDLINAPDRKGVTLLQSAAAKGKQAVVKVLLESGAAVDGVQRPGLTPLHYAAGNGHKAIVDLLLSKGAKADAQTENGVTPLHLAARKGYEEVAKALLAAGAPVNAKGSGSSDSEDLQYQIGGTRTPLHLAAAAGYTGMVELLLAKGADANVEDGDGQTPLSLATWKPQVMQLLLAAHANPNAGRVNLPLARAAFEGDLPSLKLLLANGADPNTNSMVNWSVNTRGSSYGQGGTFPPLSLAVRQQHADAAKELLDSKANPNVTSPGDRPLLYEALADAPTLKVLLEGGAKPNQSVGGTPLLVQAVFDKNQAAVELLLAHQADVSVADSEANYYGWTSLHVAAQTGDKAIAELLLKAGADVNARDKNGNTPLYVAVERRQPVLAELLLANKANPNERNNAGVTPLDLAKSQAQSGQQQPPGAGGYPGMSVGVPMSSPGASPPLNYQWQRAPGTPAATPGQESKPEAMADLLRRHGAVDDLPQLDRIRVCRRSTGDFVTAFTKGTNDWGQFTLLDLIGAQCGFLASFPNEGGGERYEGSVFANKYSRWAFPDLAHLRIRRPAADLKSWQEQVVDFRPVLESGDCSKDVRLEWGDVVEIPEADHPLNEKWPGFSNTELANLMKCLTRQVEIVINGQATNITLAPRITPLQPNGMPLIVIGTPFWLKPVLLQSKLVLTSSDLRHVKVTRRDPASGQQREWVVDCSTASPAPDFWLRDGDKIEVPEKTNSASAEEATLASPAPAMNITFEASPAVQEQPNRMVRTKVSETPRAVEKQHLNIGGVLYSPKPDDPELLKAGCHQDRTAKTRKAECWEKRAGADLKGRASAAVWTGTEMVVFGGEGMGTSFDDGARYCLAEDTWALLPQKGAPSSRTGHAMVWTGKEVIIWGGFAGLRGDNTNHNDGARYNPSTDTWKPVTTRNAPSARFDFPAVWTGKEMLVWGGYTDNQSRYQGAHADAYLNTGGRYNPSTDTWKTMATSGAPSPRSFHTLVWTGKEMILWGGGNARKVMNDGYRYNPTRDSWTPISTDGAPGPRYGHVAVWTGKEMIVWGGSAREAGTSADYFENGARYNLETDTWKPISTLGAPKGRVSATAVWTGAEMVLWGGVNDAQAGGEGDFNRYVGTGARYNPATDTWTEITTTGAPSPRLTSVVWAGEGLLTFGGYNGTHLNDAWFYSPSRTLYPYVKE